MNKACRQKKQTPILSISLCSGFYFHYQVLWFTLLAVESFDFAAILGFHFVDLAPITKEDLVRQIIPVIATLIATSLFALSRSLLWRSFLTLISFLTSTLVKQVIANNLSIIATTWYLVLGGIAASVIFLDNFSFLECAIGQIRQLNNPNARNFAINFCFEECKAYLDKIFTTTMALASALAAAMAILWGAPDQILPASRGERLVSAINMIIGFSFTGLELLFWGFKPLWNHIASLRELAITSVDCISENEKNAG